MSDTIIDPYAGGGQRWLKGQLHCHSTRSDGGQAPETVLTTYLGHGYDFCALTDHNQFHDGAAKVHPNLVQLTGCEANSTDYGPHIGVVGLAAALPLFPGHDAAFAAAVASGGFVTCNHPWWMHEHWSEAALLAQRGAHAIEVYNALIETHSGTSACEVLWDRLLSCGQRLWGTATDDAHQADERDRAWVMVDAARDAAAIVAALKAGRFYASSGAVLRRIALEDGGLVVEGEGVEEIRFYCRKGEMHGRRMGSSARYRLREDDLYVRAVAYGRGAAMAWTNPVFIDNEAGRKFTAEFLAWNGARTGLR
jgi:predicted metal-dependent phosphoesterase TrpH